MRHKVKSAVGIIALGFWGSAWIREKVQIYGILKEAFDLADKYPYNANIREKKYFVLLDSQKNSGKAIKLFRIHAEPVFMVSSSNYSVIELSEGLELKFVLERIKAASNPEVILAGDDYFINKCLNQINKYQPNLLTDTTVGIIPVGTINRFYGRLSPTTFTKNTTIANAALSCLHGRSVPIFPLIITTEDDKDNPVIAIDSVKTNHVAYYENMLMLNKYKLFGLLKYLLCYFDACYLASPSHTCTIICNDQTNSFDTLGVNLSYQPLLKNSFKAQMLSTSHFFSFERIKNLYCNSENLFFTNQDESISFKDVICNVSLKSSQGYDTKVIYDGVSLPHALSTITVKQSDKPLFNSYTPLITLNSTQLIDDAKTTLKRPSPAPETC